MTQPVALTHPYSSFTRRNLYDDATCTTCHHASASLEAKLKNPSATSLQTKQVTRSRCVSHTVLPSSVLWRNRQTKAHLVLRPKPRNHRGDFEVQITKP
jgi:hypothetical protein